MLLLLYLSCDGTSGLQPILISVVPGRVFVCAVYLLNYITDYALPAPGRMEMLWEAWGQKFTLFWFSSQNLISCLIFYWTRSECVLEMIQNEERKAHRLAQSLEENKDQWPLLWYDGQGVMKGLTRLSFSFTHVCDWNVLFLWIFVSATFIL